MILPNWQPLRALAARTCIALALCVPATVASAHAEDFTVDDLWFVQRDAGYSIYADLGLAKTQAIDDLVQSGYTAMFLFEVQFIKERWYWDEFIGDITWSGALSYDSLLQRYRLRESGSDPDGDSPKHFATLADAMREILQIRAKPSRDPAFAKLFTRDNIYLQARFRLVANTLPQPVQIALLLSNDLDTTGKWRVFPLVMR